MRIKYLTRILLVIFLSLIIVSCKSNKNIVPTFQNMTVTEDNINLGSEEYKTNLKNSKDDLEIDKIIKDDFGNINQVEVDYLVEKDVDFFINIKLNNPSNFEILSFTLNGIFYQSFQFEYGSNSENLILKTNSKMISGIKEYTIDKIKYVDKSEIKDVLIEGKNNVKVGVKYDSFPEFKLGSIELDSFSTSLSFEIKDVESIIEKSSGILKLFLFNNNVLHFTSTVEVGTNNIEINDLEPNIEYQYIIATNLNLFDGNNNQVVTLARDKFITKSLVEIQIMNLTQDGFSFSLIKSETDLISSVEKIELYNNDKLISIIDDFEKLEFKGLLSDTKYDIKVIYKYFSENSNVEKEGIYSKSIKTKTKQIPKYDFLNIVTTQTSVSFDLMKEDIDDVSNIVKIELYQGNDLIQTLDDFSVGMFGELQSNQLYDLKITYTYNLNDGKGVIVVEKTESILTEAIPINVTGLNVLNTINAKVGEEVHVRIFFDNPSKIEIKAFYINEQKIDVMISNITNNAIIKFIPEFDGGIYEVNVTSLVYESNGLLKELEIESLFTDTILIMGTLEVLSLYEKDGNDYFAYDKKNYLTIELENPTCYQIKEVVLAVGGYSFNLIKFSDAQFNLIDNNTLEIVFNSFSDYNFYRVYSITYGLDGYEYSTKTVSGVETVVYGVSSKNVTPISNVDELQNMNERKIYELTNDIDATGFKWVPYNFNGILKGNGYSINNLSIVVENELENQQYIGLFTEVNQSKIESLILNNPYLSIKTRGAVRMGGFIAYGQESTISNLRLSKGFFSVITTNSNDLSTQVGGLVGTDYNAGINILNSSINDSIFQIYSTGSVTLGGIISSANLELKKLFAINNTMYVESDREIIVGGLAGGSGGVSDSFTFGTDIKIKAKNKQLATIGSVNAKNWYSDSKTINTYRDSNSSIIINGDKCAEGDRDKTITIDILNSKDFYIKFLNWDTSVWDINDLNYGDGKYIKNYNLKK